MSSSWDNLKIRTPQISSQSRTSVAAPVTLLKPVTELSQTLNSVRQSQTLKPGQMVGIESLDLNRQSQQSKRSLLEPVPKPQTRESVRSFVLMHPLERDQEPNLLDQEETLPELQTQELMESDAKVKERKVLTEPRSEEGLSKEIQSLRETMRHNFETQSESMDKIHQTIQEMKTCLENWKCMCKKADERKSATAVGQQPRFYINSDDD